MVLLDEETKTLLLKDQEFQGERNEDGTYTIRNVPIFADHKVPGPGPKKFIDGKWLAKAVAKSQQRFEEDEYRAPLHIQHHGGTDKPEPAGFFMPTKVSTAKFEGRDRLVVFADLLDVPEEVFEEIKQGKLPYRSVEILDVKKPSIDSLALLDTEVPFFRFKPLKVTSVKKATKVAASLSPVMAYRVGGSERSMLFNFGGSPMPEEELKEHKDDEEEEAKEEKAQEETPMAEVLKILKAIAEKVGAEVEEEAPGDEVEGEPGPVEVEATADTATSESAASASTPAVTAYSALRAKVAALESYQRRQQRKDAIAALVRNGQKQLSDYSLDEDDHKRLYEAAQCGEASVKLYVATMRKLCDKEPAETFAESFGAGSGESEELQSFTQSPEKLATARVYNAQYDELESQGMKPSVTRLQFIMDQFSAGGVSQEVD